MHVILLIAFLLIIELLLLFFSFLFCVFFSIVYQLNLFIFNSLSLKNKLRRTIKYVANHPSAMGRL